MTLRSASNQVIFGWWIAVLALALGAVATFATSWAIAYWPAAAGSWTDPAWSAEHGPGWLCGEHAAVRSNSVAVDRDVLVVRGLVDFTDPQATRPLPAVWIRPQSSIRCGMSGMRVESRCARNLNQPVRRSRTVGTSPSDGPRSIRSGTVTTAMVRPFMSKNSRL